VLTRQRSPWLTVHGWTMVVRRPACQLDRLQSVLNALARLIYRSRNVYHVTPPLHDVHWSRNPERITFRLAVLTYRCQNGLAPQYMADVDCDTDRPSHGAFYTISMSSVSLPVFQKHFKTYSSNYSLLTVIATLSTFYTVTLFYSVVLRAFYYNNNNNNCLT